MIEARKPQNEDHKKQYNKFQTYRTRPYRLSQPKLLMAVRGLSTTYSKNVKSKAFIMIVEGKKRPVSTEVVLPLIEELHGCSAHI